MEITDAIRWMYFLYCCTILDYVSLLITMYFCKENNAFHSFFSRFLSLNLNNLTGHCSLLFCFPFFFQSLSLNLNLVVRFEGKVSEKPSQ